MDPVLFRERDRIEQDHDVPSMFELAFSFFNDHFGDLDAANGWLIEDLGCWALSRTAPQAASTGNSWRWSRPPYLSDTAGAS
jgi:hypothetical protein